MGPHLLTKHDYALSSFVASARQNEAIHVTRNHPTFRSYMDSRDMVRWLIELCGAARPGTEVVNVGSMAAVELGEVAAKVASRWNVDVVDAQRADDSWGDDDTQVDWYIPDTTKARKALALETTTTLEQFLDSVRAGDE
jgi:nucleoside-diphosphate-sugar epimerase